MQVRNCHEGYDLSFKGNRLYLTKWRWGGVVEGLKKEDNLLKNMKAAIEKYRWRSLQMDRLGQIIVICFLRTTDAGGWRGETRIKEEEKKRRGTHPSSLRSCREQIAARGKK